MKFLLNITLTLFFFNAAFAENHLKFFIDSALKNNLKLNAERKNQKSIKQNINISRSEFLPSISLSSNQSGSQSTNKTNQSGSSLSDSSLNTETTTVSIDQKIFQGFKGYNSLKKSELEVQQADFKLKQTEQQTILDTISAYFDFIFKTKNEEFNLSNVNLFERQVESDSARLQKGEITLTDLAQSESSLAGANANLIKAKTELLASKTNFERVIREKAPSSININEATLSTDISYGNSYINQSEETTHYSIVDKQGNAVSVTTTINSGYGNGITITGAGFLMNNEMDDFSSKPGEPNMFGLLGNEANSIEPKKRPLSSMTPTIVLKDDKPFLILGTPGGSTIITTVLQNFLNVVIHEMDIQKAVSSPRVHSQWMPDMVFHEKRGLSKSLIRKLSERGHDVKLRGNIGEANGIMINDQGFWGGPDSRGENTAIGY